MILNCNMTIHVVVQISVSKEGLEDKMLDNKLMRKLLEVRDSNLEEETKEKDPLKTKKPKELKGEKFDKLQKMEAKVNEQDDEDDLPPEEPEDTEALDKPESEKPEREGPREKPEGEEVPEITKEYVGNTEDTHYYLISNEDEAGNVEDLQIVDQEGVEKFSAQANAIETENVPEFLFKAIQELRIESIEFSIFSTYLYPYVFEEDEEEDMEEAPEDLDQMEDPEEPVESKKKVDEVYVSMANWSGKEAPKQTPGQPALNISGEIIPNSIALDSEDVAYVQDGQVIIHSINRIRDEVHNIELSPEQFRYISKLDIHGAETEEPVESKKKVKEVLSRSEEDKIVDFEDALDNLISRTLNKIQDQKEAKDFIKELFRVKTRELEEYEWGVEEPVESKNESKSPLTEMKVTDHENNTFNVQLVDDGTMDTVIDISGREFRFDAEFASYWRDEDGSMTEEGLKQLALDALSSMEEEEYNELVAAASTSEEESEEVPEKEKANEYESKTDEAKMGIDYVKAAKASMKKAATSLKDKDHEEAIKALEDVADDAADAAKALKKMKREEDAKAAADAEKEKNEAATEEGKDNPGVRDGTGPAKGSAQRKEKGDVGKRKEAGETCPNESKTNEGYTKRKKRTGTGPHKDSAQRSISKKGKRKERGEKCPNETKVDEGEGDLAVSTKEVYEVEFEKDGQRDKTRVMAFDEGEAKKTLDDKPGCKALSARLITSENKVNEDVKHVLPGTYKVVFYDGSEEEYVADSKVDAISKGRRQHPNSQISFVKLVQQLGKKEDVHFDAEVEETKEQALTKSLLDLLG